MNKKGFSYVEMVCAIFIISIIVAILIHLIHPKFLYAKESTFINQANSLIKAAISKYTSDSADVEEIYPDDIYKHHKENDEYLGRVCYNISSLKDKYVEKLSNDYQGSIEICTLSTCEYKTRIWLSNNKYFIAGAKDNVTKNDLTKHVLGINRCGYTYE
jgi:prepilin-type N-terminal cleavage/methylation domain-containing protein